MILELSQYLSNSSEVLVSIPSRDFMILEREEGVGEDKYPVSIPSRDFMILELSTKEPEPIAEAFQSLVGIS